MNRIASCRSVILFFVLMVVVNVSHAMGVTPGQFSVGSSGAATYSIPIQVPPGTAGMQPNLSLVYNSQSGNGIFGQGWSLDGLPVIHRCPATYEQDGFKGGINYDEKDRLCLNGQRLVAINGLYGANGTEYRTEIESFSKIISYGQAGSGPASFKVWSKSGQIMEFGVTADSRIEALNRADVRVWANNKVQDTVGNYLTIAYDEKNDKGQYCPTRIDYTANDAQGLAAQRSVRLESIARTDITTQYVAGSKVVTDRLISNIKTYVGDALIKRYEINYGIENLSNRQTVNSIKECDAGGKCFDATRFSVTKNIASNFNFTGAGSGTWQGHGGDLGNNIVGDFNGDGLQDIAAYTGTGGNWHVTLSTGTNFTAPGSGTWQGHSGGPSNNVVADFNGDGMDDIASFTGTGGNWHVTLSTGTNFNGPGSGIWQGHGGGVSNNAVADFNGDGMADMAGFTGTGGNWHVTLSTGTNFNGPGSGTWRGHGGGPNNNAIGDFNGDGMADMAGFTGTGGNWHVTLSTGTNFNGPGSGTWQGHGGGPNNNAIGDFNGDGMADMAASTGSGGKWHVTLSTGTNFNGSGSGTWQGHGGDLGNNVVADFNGDGMADMAGFTGTGGNWHVTLSTGTNFTGVGSGTWQGHGGGPNNNAVGDFNGDGMADMAGSTGSGGKWHVTLSGTKVANLISNITDGHGAKTEMTYKPLTDNTVYTKGSGAVYPEIDIQAPQYVVSNYAMSDGLGGMYQMDYKYAGAKAHLRGRGSLGFKSMTVTDSRTGISAVSNYRQDYPFTGSAESTETRLSDSTLIKRTSATYASRILGSGSSERKFVYANNSVEETFELDGSPVTNVSTTSQYDDYGNPTQLVVDSNDGYIKTTVNTYNNDIAKWLLGRLTTASITSQTPAQGTQTRTSGFSYDPITGLLSQEVIEPNNLAFELITDYGYDGFGNKTAATISGAGITSRTTSTAYDAVYHTFPVSVTNAAGHNETREYDPAFGKRTSLTGPNGLTTTWFYDGFGRVSNETRADGTQTNKTYTNCTTGCPFESPFYVTTSTTGSPTSTMYFDKVGREVMSESEGFSSVVIYKKSEYDNLGRVARASQNYYVGGQIYWTDYTYDVLGRVLSETNPDQSRTDITYNGLTTITENDKNQITTKVKDSQGQLIQSTDDLGSDTTYAYDPFGNLLYVLDPQNNTSSMSYDLRGRKVGMDDPDMGVWSYEYNVLGELTKQTDAKLQVVSMKYDVLGRLVERTEPEGISTWEYDTANKGIGKLTKSVSSSGFEKIQSYDDLGRPDRATTVVNGTPYVVQTTFDSLGRVDTLSYPTGLQIRNAYTALGYLKEVRNGAASNELYWQLDAVNARGQTTQYTLGNGLTTVNSYDDDTGRIKGITTGAGTSSNIQNLNYNFDTLGNLTSRNDVNQSLTETFAYDSLNRLTETNFQGLGSKTYQYDSLGNITHKSDVGDYTYGQTNAGPHAVTQTSRLGIVENTYSYDANGNQISGAGRTLTYTSFNKALSITKGTTTVNYAYDAERNRIQKVKGTDYTVYIGKLYEKVLKAGVVEHKQYISVGGKTFAVFNTKGTTIEQRYLHKDHLGSTDVITDEAGDVVERQSFDPHGQRRNINWQDGFTYTGLVTSRGFTGHEMDDEIGLINMNARMYDPVLGRFLSPDTYVQFPDNAQSYNRYTYVNNNPLSFTDPSGHFLKKLFKKITKGIKKLFKNKIFRAVAAIAAGVFTAGLAFNAYVGGALQAAGGLAGTANIGAILTAGKVVAGIAGGFVAGVLGSGSLEGGLIGAITGGIAGYINASYTGVQKVLADGVAGGVSSELQGGKFKNGFFGALKFSAIKYIAVSSRSYQLKQSAQVYGQIGKSSGVFGLIGKLGGERISQSTWFKYFNEKFDPEDPLLRGKLLRYIRLESENRFFGGAPFGGFQGGPGVFFGIEYKPGGIIDRVVESFSGVHDTLNQIPFYNDKGISTGLFGFNNNLSYAIGEGINAVNVAVAAPIVAVSVTPDYIRNYYASKPKKK